MIVVIGAVVAVVIVVIVVLRRPRSVTSYSVSRRNCPKASATELAKFRDSRGYTLEEVAALLDVAPSKLTRIEPWETG